MIPRVQTNFIVSFMLCVTAIGCEDSTQQTNAGDTSSVVAATSMRRQAICPPDVTRILARAFSLSNPLIALDLVVREAPERSDLMTLDDPHPIFVSWLKENALAFTDSSAAIVCARSFGPVLAQQGISMYQPDLRDRAIERFGSMDLPPDIFDRMGDGAANAGFALVHMGAELVWLSQVLPAAAAGDWRRYLENASAIRQERRTGTQLMRMGMTDRELAQILWQSQGYYPHLQQHLEGQIVLLAAIHSVRLER